MDLFFDTETTGFPNKKSPLDDPSQPHLVQLGAVLCDGRVVRAQLDLIINPGVPIPEKATAVHGITDEMAAKYGVDPPTALLVFNDLLKKADRLIAHNLAFDIQLIDIGFARCGINPVYPNEQFCTMQASTDILRLPNKNGGNKWPTLMEAYKHLVDPEGFDDAHSAYADVMACALVYWAILERGGD